MVVDQPEEVVALVLTFVVHLAGAGLLVWAMLDPGERRRGWRDWWPRDDGRPPDEPPGPRPDAPRRAPLPLPGGEPSRVRLRTCGRAADGYPRPVRRPAHAPDPRRAPDRAR